MQAYPVNTIYGATFLLVSAILPTYLLRRHEMSRHDDEMNRDQIIADKITEAAGKGGRVIAVVGADHLESISDNLPNELELKKTGPVYKVHSLHHAKEVLVPAFTAGSVLFILYLVILEVFRRMLFLLM